MAARSPSSSYTLQALTTFIRRYRTISDSSWRRHRDLPPYKVVSGGRSLGQGLRLLSVTSNLATVKWLLGSVVTFVLPFWKNKWDNLLLLEGKAVKVVEEAVAVVEKVATTADKALEEVVSQLPDNCKLKEAAQALEHVSGVASKDAQLIENIINKVIAYIS